MSELIEVSLAKLEAHPNNIRKEIARDAAFDDLVAGIRAVGLIHPPVVIPHPTAKTKYRIVTGHRRHAAAQVAGLKKISVDLHMDLSEQQQRDMQYQENKHRVGNTLMERARYVANELDLGGRTVADLAKGMGVTQDQVRTSKKLSHAPGKAHAQINDGQMNLEDALTLAEFNGDVEAQDALLEAWGTWNWSIMVRQWKNLRAAQKLAPKTQRELVAAGATIAESADAVGPRRYADAALSVEEHIAAGHVAVIDQTSTGKADWFTPVVAADDTVGLSEEEIAAGAARVKAEEDLAAELVLAGQTRREEFKEMLAVPRPGVALRLIVASTTTRVVRNDHQELLGLPEKATEDDVTAVLVKLGVEGCIILGTLMENSWEETQLSTDLDAWGPSWTGRDYYKKWRDLLHDELGHEWNDLERSFMDKKEILTARVCPECGDIQDEPLDAGIMCDDCADDAGADQ